MQQMQPYDPLFPRGSPQAQLDQIDRRFAWFRRLLRGVDLRFDGVFPKHWRLQHRLCMRFLDQTRAALADILEGGSKEAEDVTVLLKAVHKCLAFENEAHSRFEGKGEDSQRANEVELDAEGNLIDPNSAEGIKRKYAKAARDVERGSTTSHGAPKSLFATLSADGEGVREEVEGSLPTIVGVLSGVFEPFMGPYIAFERRNLDDLITAASRTASSPDDDIDRDRKLPVFSTSVNIFVYIKNSIQRCTKFTTGQTFFDLHQEYNLCLREYASLLQTRLPASQATAGQQHRLADDGEVTVCYVVNTAEYCADILPQLEDMIKSKMDPSFAEKVDLAEEQEPYYNVITQSIRVLVSGLETRVEPAFRAMSATNWGSCEMVGEESHYVRSIHDAFQSFVPNIRSLLSTVYFRNFCDKMVTSFLPSFLGLILRQRRVNEMGTQQLLLDVYNLKTLMLKVPSLGLDPMQSTPVPVSYTKYVTKHMSKIEMVLKLVGTPHAMLVERFQIMWPDGGATDLQAIMTLKGMRKADQQMILDTLGMDRVPSTARGEATGTAGAAAVAPATTTTTAAATAIPESGPLGSARLTANIPNFETNTRFVVPPSVCSCAAGCASIEVAYFINAIAWITL
ncbi:unnamed protein product [Laminaria digitata]